MPTTWAINKRAITRKKGPVKCRSFADEHPQQRLPHQVRARMERLPLPAALVSPSAVERDALLREIPRQGPGDFRFGCGEQPAATDDPHLDAGAGKELAELGAGKAATDHQQGLGECFEIEGRRARQIVGRPDAGKGWHGGRAPVVMITFGALTSVPFTSAPPVASRAGP